MFFLRNGYNYMYNLDIYQENCSHQVIKDMRSIPHNFAYCMAPDQTVYIAGGGDFGTSDKSVLTNLYQLDFKDECASKKLASMIYQRHGHTIDYVQNPKNASLIVIGSRKDEEEANIRCEEYDIDSDTWKEIPYLNVGRYYHSSALFYNKFIYVFGGICQKVSGKYLNTIEFLNLERKNCWDIISFQENEFPKRQGCGSMQLDEY